MPKHCMRPMMENEELPHPVDYRNNSEGALPWTSIPTQG